MTLAAIVQRYLESYNALDVASLVERDSDSVGFEHVSNSGGSIMIKGRAAFAGLRGYAAALFVRRRLSGPRSSTTTGLRWRLSGPVCQPWISAK